MNHGSWLPRKSEFDELLRYTTHQREPFYRVALDYYSPGQRCLDIGAGAGKFADLLGSEDIDLVEGNPESAQLLRSRYRNVHQLVLPADLPFPDGYFHLIHSSHVIEHFYPEQLYQVLKEIDRCLAPGGHLVISTPLMWDGFYDDLSHIKPYAPEVLKKYLCASAGAPGIQRTRPSISANGYDSVRLVYRHRRANLPQLSLSRYRWAQWLSYLFSVGCNSIGLSFYEKTGYTAVLRKCTQSRPSD